MEFKGTKGNWIKTNEPWFSEERKTYSGSFDIKSEDGKTKIVEVNAYNFWGLSLEEAKANAQLISKAPEMLNMLQNAKQVLEDAGFDAKSLIKSATEL